MPGQYELGDLSGVLGGDLYGSLFNSLGYSNWNDQSNYATGESGDMSAFNWSPSNEAYDFIGDQGMRFNWSPTGGQGGLLEAFNKQGQSTGKYTQEDEDGFTKLMNVAAPSLASWGFGSALAPMFGGGVLGSAAGHGLSQGTMSSMQGGSFGQGLLSGAISGGLTGMSQGTPSVMGNNPSAFVPAQAGTSFAQMAGITNPTLSGMFNRGVNSTLGGLASGKSGSEALQGGLVGAGLAGINSLGSQGMSFLNKAFSSLLPSSGNALNDMEFDSLQGSGGDMSGQTDVSPNRYDEFISGADGMTSYNPDYGFGGDQLANSFSGPTQSIQSAGQFSLPSFVGNVGSRMGNYAVNNMGDLATMLYGFYNNRKQQRALGNQLNSLEGLYSQNSPYAQQLRNTLNAKAAATGRRSNVAGRETQLQAALADRYAQLQPTMMNINQQRGMLQNSMGSNALSMLNKMGAFSSLGSLFGNKQPDYNQLGLLEGSR